MSKRQTPVALLIEAMQEELESSPKEVWQGMEYAIAIAKTFLPVLVIIIIPSPDILYHQVSLQSLISEPLPARLALD